MMYGKVEGHSALIKSGANIINNDKDAYEAAKLRKAKLLSDAESKIKLQKKVDDMETKINNLDKKIEKILSLLEGH